MFKGTRILILALLIFVGAISIYADVPNYVNYQGRLTDLGGQPVNGPKLIKFIIYGSPTGTDILWSSDFRTVQINDGLFEYKLGSNVTFPADLFTGDSPRYLGITVDTDPEILPRTQFISVPYAHHALKANTADYALGGPGAGAWYDEGDVIRLATSTDRVGIGTSTPSERLVVGKDIGFYGGKFIVSGSPSTDDVCGFKMGYSADEHATLKWNGDGDPFAIHTRQGGVNYDNALVINSGKVGINKAYPAVPLDVSGDAMISGKLGVGISPSSFKMEVKSSGSSDGFRVTSGDGSQLFRIRESSAGSCEAYISDNAGNTGVLIRGEGNSYFNAGDVAIGTATHADNTVLTVEGSYDISEPEIGYGIKSNVNVTGNTNGWAGYFTSNRCALFAGGQYGAYIDAESMGLYATGDPAAYFYGDVMIDGNLSKSSGSFKIDHPLDPENKYLQHSFVESPDMMNIYNGNIILDDKGQATVVLPDYFDALNKDFRYQLTAIGAPGPNLYIAMEIEEKRFVIAGGRPGMKVSWQVTGIRQDKWAEAHRIQVEMDKPDYERGLYLAPELYGFGEEKRFDYKLYRSLEKDGNSD